MANLLYLMGFFSCDPPQIGPANPIDFEQDLHVTLLPAFSIAPERLGELREELAAVIPQFSHLMISPRELTVLGTARRIPACLVDSWGADPAMNLENLHKTLAEKLLALGGYFYEPHFTAQAFTPHVSHWSGDGELTLTHLTLVHHGEGFLRGVENLANYRLGEKSPPLVGLT